MNLRIFISLPFLFSVSIIAYASKPQKSNITDVHITEWVMSDFLHSSDKTVRILGNPMVVNSKYGKALSFDGKDDGLFLEEMPLAGLEQFTIEAIVRFDEGGLSEQRFFHCGEIGGGRVLMETRATSKDWYFDAFVNSEGNKKTLVDLKLVHPLGKWYHVAFVVDKGRLKTYVDGKKELEDKIGFVPLQTGITSIGVRQNELSWFKGAIYKIRISPKALNPDVFMKQ